jgi:outer membrane murein-binding lipoprotein Lpp
MTTALAIIGILAVVLGFVTAVIGLANQRRIRSTASDVQNISVQVDGRLSALLEREAQLLAALHGSGTAVPPASGETGERLEP